MAPENANKRIVVRAFLQQNLGDDMFVRMLVRRYPDHRFCIAASPADSAFLSREANVRLMSGGQFLLRRLAGKIAPGVVRQERMKRMRRADAVVKIGGSVFIEYPGWENAVSEIPNPNYYIIGANFGPFSTQEFVLKKKKSIARSKDCCFRDSASYELFRDLPQVRVAPDILWAYPDYPDREVGQGVGISILNLKAFHGLGDRTESYERGIARICDRCCEAGERVTLFGFCRKDGDEEAVSRILSYRKTSGTIDAVYYDGDIPAFLSALNRVETLYASRFHAMILGFAMHKKVIPIIYSIKQVNALADLGFTGACWSILDSEPLHDDVLFGEGQRLSDDAVRELQERARGQFSGLDEFLCTSDPGTMGSMNNRQQAVN